MTRDEGIAAITAAWSARDHEFCIGHDEYTASEFELVQALLAIGITEAELTERGYDVPALLAEGPLAEERAKAECKRMSEASMARYRS